MSSNINYYFARIIKRLVSPASKKNCKIHKSAKIGAEIQIVNSTVDRYSYICYGSSVINVKIGGFCSISENCVIGGAAHPLDWVSSSPVFYNRRNVLNKNFSQQDFDPYQMTEIANDVWIGSNCLIKAGLTIGNGAVVGMGSVVTKNIGNYEIWAGNPAKLIRKRFDEKTIKSLMESKWWEWDDEKLAKSADIFNDVEKFIERIGV